eukprot:m.280025 g.280025  ORF g.280025 m.280025 type:complete len:217 (-) comp19818_c0_seq15:685-1335(-)
MGKKKAKSKQEKQARGLQQLQQSEGGRLVLKARSLADHLASISNDELCRYISPKDNTVFTLQCMQLGTTMNPALIPWAFQLVRENMHDLYVASEQGWLEKSKRKEMRTADMHYIVGFSAEGDPVGFLSFLFDIEAEEEVVYCYELQVVRSHQHCGIGGALMRAYLSIGQHAQMKKAMLTCFKHNTAGQHFFVQKNGFVVDAFTPDDVDYTILSKAL